MVGIAGDRSGKDERVALLCSDEEVGEHVVPETGGSWQGGLSTPG